MQPTVNNLAPKCYDEFIFTRHLAPAFMNPSRVVPGLYTICGSLAAVQTWEQAALQERLRMKPSLSTDIVSMGKGLYMCFR